MTRHVIQRKALLQKGIVAMAMLESGSAIKPILAELNISRATYYRALEALAEAKLLGELPEVANTAAPKLAANRNLVQSETSVTDSDADALLA